MSKSPTHNSNHKMHARKALPLAIMIRGSHSALQGFTYPASIEDFTTQPPPATTIMTTTSGFNPFSTPSESTTAFRSSIPDPRSEVFGSTVMKTRTITITTTSQATNTTNFAVSSSTTHFPDLWALRFRFQLVRQLRQ